HASRIFDISQNQRAVAVTIAGLTIENGLSPSSGNGGAILNVSSTLNLTNDVLSNNVAQKTAHESPQGFTGGGAVYTINVATLTVTNCAFSGNQAIGGDNGGSALGGAIFVSFSSTATISGSLFTGSLAQGGNGGAPGNGFPGNGLGGALRADSGSTLTVEQST